MGIQSKVSAYSFLGMHLLSLWYRPLSINIRLIVLLAVPYCHIISPGGVASLRPQMFIALSRHSAYCLVATQIPPYCGQQRVISPNRINSIPLVSSKLITNIIFSIYGTPLTLGLYILIIYTSPLYIWIIITAISGLTACYNYKNRLTALLIIKYTYIAAFGSYRSWNPQGHVRKKFTSIFAAFGSIWRPNTHFAHYNVQRMVSTKVRHTAAFNRNQ